MKRYYGIREISEYTGLPVKTLYDWAAQGIVPSIKIQRRVLFDLADMDKFMESLKRPSININERARKIIG
jgi:excisionase family DNA binding protein